MLTSIEKVGCYAEFLFPNNSQLMKLSKLHLITISSHYRSLKEDFPSKQFDMELKPSRKSTESSEA